jgi:phosphoribosyl-dephospho-CoA transferase
MDMKPHYLIKIARQNDLVTNLPLPDWAITSLHRAPFVVVRRAETAYSRIPIGIRGPERQHRFAASLPAHKAVAAISPYSLIWPANWKKVYPSRQPAAIRALQQVTPFLIQAGFRWGPTGSIGFELATGVATVNDSSDLDLLIDLPDFVNVRAARRLMTDLKKRTPVRLDVQLNTPRGGVSLADYIDSQKVLVKTPSGPVLQPIHSLWS